MVYFGPKTSNFALKVFKSILKSLLQHARHHATLETSKNFTQHGQKSPKVRPTTHPPTRTISVTGRRGRHFFLITQVKALPNNETPRIVPKENSPLGDNALTSNNKGSLRNKICSYLVSVRHGGAQF